MVVAFHFSPWHLIWWFIDMPNFAATETLVTWGVVRKRFIGKTDLSLIIGPRSTIRS
jgi:hypothetical protein